MTEQTVAGKKSGSKKIWIWLVSIIGLLVLTWATMLYNDYNRVMRNYEKPAFCINHDQAYQDYRDIPRGATWEEYLANNELRFAGRYLMDYGYFEGLGYSVELSGAFMPYFRPDDEQPARDKKTNDLLNPWPGVLQARFYLLGREIGRVDRPYPEDAGRTEDWQMREIF